MSWAEADDEGLECQAAKEAAMLTVEQVMKERETVSPGGAGAWALGRLGITQSNPGNNGVYIYIYIYIIYIYIIYIIYILYILYIYIIYIIYIYYIIYIIYIYIYLMYDISD